MASMLCGIWLPSPAWGGKAPDGEPIPLVVAIDIGHDKRSSGAQSATGIPEFSFNETVARALMRELGSSGHVKPFLVNENGESVSLKERANIALRKGAKLLVSIHHDSVQPSYLQTWSCKGISRHYCDLFSGFSLFVSLGNEHAAASLRFAELVGTALLQRRFHPTLHHAEKIRGENRRLLDPQKGIYQFDELVVLKHAGMPAILVECGVLVNRAEEQCLLQPAYVAGIASALSQAMRAYATAAPGR